MSFPFERMPLNFLCRITPVAWSRNLHRADCLAPPASDHPKISSKFTINIRASGIYDHGMFRETCNFLWRSNNNKILYSYLPEHHGTQLLVAPAKNMTLSSYGRHDNLSRAGISRFEDILFGYITRKEFAVLY